MSKWTHITACLSVETDIQDKHILGIVRKYIRKGPKITGSEKNADIFLNLPNGYNMYIDADCDCCIYGNSRRWIDDAGLFECSSPNNYKCPEGKYQTCVIISIQGDLRDRVKEQTLREFNEFLNYIKNEYDVRDYSVNVKGD